MLVSQLRQIAEGLRDIARRLDRIEITLNIHGEITMSALDDLAKQVQANTDVNASAVQLIQGLASQLIAAAANPSQIMVLASNLKNSADALASAIVANTPATTTPATTDASSTPATDVVGAGGTPPGQGPGI